MLQVLRSRQTHRITETRDFTYVLEVGAGFEYTGADEAEITKLVIHQTAEKLNQLTGPSWQLNVNLDNIIFNNTVKATVIATQTRLVETTIDGGTCDEVH